MRNLTEKFLMGIGFVLFVGGSWLSALTRFEAWPFLDYRMYARALPDASIRGYYVAISDEDGIKSVFMGDEIFPFTPKSLYLSLESTRHLSSDFAFKVKGLAKNWLRRYPQKKQKQRIKNSPYMKFFGARIQFAIFNMTV